MIPHTREEGDAITANSAYVQIQYLEGMIVK